MTKLPKNTYPSGHGPEDFECFGPPATMDGEFGECKIADLGCFDQTGRDTNKYYHGAIVCSKKDNGIWVYFEWGRTGGTSKSFQFYGCSSDREARKIFSDQLWDKNAGRGIWTTIGGVRTLQAKKDKDCYLVRPLATRSTGLPDAKTIHFNEGAKAVPAKTATTSSSKVDGPTLSLLHDLSMATVEYAKGATVDASIPTQKANDEARMILQECMKRIAVVKTIDDQQHDPQLIQYTKLLYGRIPKKKPLHADPSSWVLNQDNILAWLADLDAFESALYSSTHYSDKDPMAGLPIRMQWVDPNSQTGKCLYHWWPKASNNAHSYLDRMVIKNIWQIEKHKDVLPDVQSNVVKAKTEINTRPLFQQDRPDWASAPDLYKNSNTALLFHGSRSVNVSGILQKNFRLPAQLVNVHLTGALFGGGVYFADDWRKSAGYTSVRNAIYTAGEGAVKGRAAFMFAVDVVLGRTFVADQSHGYTTPPARHHSVMGKGNHSKYYDRYSRLQTLKNNEYVIYDVNQQSIRYLAEFASS